MLASGSLQGLTDKHLNLLREALSQREEINILEASSSALECDWNIFKSLFIQAESVFFQAKMVLTSQCF